MYYIVGHRGSFVSVLDTVNNIKETVSLRLLTALAIDVAGFDRNTTEVHIYIQEGRYNTGNNASK